MIFALNLNYISIVITIQYNRIAFIKCKDISHCNYKNHKLKLVEGINWYVSVDKTAMVHIPDVVVGGINWYVWVDGTALVVEDPVNAAVPDMYG